MYRNSDLLLSYKVDFGASIIKMEIVALISLKYVYNQITYTIYVMEFL